MDNYQFENLTTDLGHNREIEFYFNKMSYSITNANGYWNFDNNSENINTQICRYKENDTLINFVKNLYIENTSLQDIFNNNLCTKLYIL